MSIRLPRRHLAQRHFRRGPIQSPVGHAPSIKCGLPCRWVPALSALQNELQVERVGIAVPAHFDAITVGNSTSRLRGRLSTYVTHVARQAARK